MSTSMFTVTKIKENRSTAPITTGRSSFSNAVNTSKPMPFRNALIVCGLILIVVRVGLGFGVGYLVYFLNSL